MIRPGGRRDDPRPADWWKWPGDDQDRWLERRNAYLGCPVCKHEVRFTCHHDGHDYSSVVLARPVPPRMVTLEFTEEELEALKYEFFPRMTVASVIAGNKLAARALYEIDPGLLPWEAREEIRKS